MWNKDTIAVLAMHIVPGAVCVWRARLSYPFLTVSDMMARKRTDIVLLPALLACAAWYTGSVHQRAYALGAMYPLFRMRGPIELRTVPLGLAAAHAAWALAVVRVCRIVRSGGVHSRGGIRHDLPRRTRTPRGAAHRALMRLRVGAVLRSAARVSRAVADWGFFLTPPPPFFFFYRRRYTFFGAWDTLASWSR